MWVEALPQVILSDKNNVQALDFQGGESRQLNAGKNTGKRKQTSNFVFIITMEHNSFVYKQSLCRENLKIVSITGIFLDFFSSELPRKQMNKSIS